MVGALAERRASVHLRPHDAGACAFEHVQQQVQRLRDRLASRLEAPHRLRSRSWPLGIPSIPSALVGGEHPSCRGILARVAAWTRTWSGCAQPKRSPDITAPRAEGGAMRDSVEMPAGFRFHGATKLRGQGKGAAIDSFDELVGWIAWRNDESSSTDCHRRGHLGARSGHCARGLRGEPDVGVVAGRHPGQRRNQGQDPD